MTDMIHGVCDKCRAPAVSFAVCKVATEPGSTCDATYRRCEACGGEKGAERSVRGHQALNHPAPYLQPWRRSKRKKAEKCRVCGQDRDNWRHVPSVVFDGRPAHEFEARTTMVTTTERR